MIKQIFGFSPRTWRKRSETAASEAASIETRLRHIGPSTDSFLSLGFPQDAALDAALQLSGITNVESVLGRFPPEDIQRVVAAIDESEALRPAIHATRYASSEPIKDLLTKIIKGELESPGEAPRSVTELVSRIGKKAGLCTKASNHKPVTTRLVRRHLWMSPGGFSMSRRGSDSEKVPAALYDRLTDTPTYAARMYKVQRRSWKFFSNCVACCGKIAVSFGLIRAQKSTAYSTSVAIRS